MLADSVDVVIGVDTHRDQHAIAAVTAFNGAVRAARTALGRSNLATPRVDAHQRRAAGAADHPARRHHQPHRRHQRAASADRDRPRRAPQQAPQADTRGALITHTRRLRRHHRHTPHQRARMLALRGLANRVAQLTAEADTLE